MYLKVAIRTAGLALIFASTVAIAKVDCRFYDDFEDIERGVVRDKRNGLLWKRCAEGQSWDGSTCSGEASKVTWFTAMRAASESKFMDIRGWRLPTKQEMEAVVAEYEPCRYNHLRGVGKEYGASNKIAYKVGNDVRDPGSFWTSTIDEKDSRLAWYVEFIHGNFSSFYFARGDGFNYRLVLDSSQSTSLAKAQFSDLMRRLPTLQKQTEGSEAKLTLDTQRGRAVIEARERKAEADRQQQAAQNAASQQRSGDYENLIVSRTAFGNRYSARCRSGGFGNVSKQDAERSICFWLEGRSTRCEVIDIEAAMRKACAA